jgi:hypothetical protein
LTDSNKKPAKIIDGSACNFIIRSNLKVKQYK